MEKNIITLLSKLTEEEQRIFLDKILNIEYEDNIYHLKYNNIYHYYKPKGLTLYSFNNIIKKDIIKTEYNIKIININSRESLTKYLLNTEITNIELLSILLINNNKSLKKDILTKLKIPKYLIDKLNL